MSLSTFWCNQYLIQLTEYIYNKTHSFWLQVRTELKRKFCSWRQEVWTACCGQWLAEFASQRDTVSIATVPVRQRSTGTPTRPLSAASANQDNSFIIRQTQMLPSASQPDVSLLQCSVVGAQHGTHPHENTACIRQPSAENLQVSLVIHLQDPVVLLPNMVSDWTRTLYNLIFCHLFWLWYYFSNGCFFKKNKICHH